MADRKIEDSSHRAVVAKTAVLVFWTEIIKGISNVSKSQQISELKNSGIFTKYHLNRDLNIIWDPVKCFA
jgi:hypothetical protein